MDVTAGLSGFSIDKHAALELAQRAADLGHPAAAVLATHWQNRDGKRDEDVYRRNFEALQQLAAFIFDRSYPPMGNTVVVGSVPEQLLTRNVPSYQGHPKFSPPVDSLISSYLAPPTSAMYSRPVTGS